MTRDKTSEIKLKTSQLEVSDVKKGIVETHAHTFSTRNTQDYCHHNQTLMEMLNAVQNGQRLYQAIDQAGRQLAAILANEILPNLRCTKDGLKLTPAPKAATIETEEPNDDGEEKSATAPRILKRAVKSADGERILITATQTV